MDGLYVTQTGFPLTLNRNRWVFGGGVLVSGIGGRLDDCKRLREDRPASADKRGWKPRDRLHPSAAEVARQPLLLRPAG